MSVKTTKAKPVKKTGFAKSTKTVSVLGWSGMERQKRTVFIPKDKVTISDWFHAKLKGDLCINTKGKIDRLKEIKWVGGAGTIFNRHENYHFENDKEIGFEAFMVFVKKGQTFKFKGKTYTYEKHGYKAVIEDGRDDDGEPIKK